MDPVPAAPAPLPRPVRRGRPAADPGCAGCAQLGVFRALRRAGLDVQGGSGCGPDGELPFVASPGSWAAVTGAARILTDPGATLAEASAAGARLLVLADRERPETRRAAELLAGAARPEPASPPVLVALSPCPRRMRRAPPLAIAESRCNRCGACLSLACPAISDAGGEALLVDPEVCSGCGQCAPLCRARAIAPARSAPERAGQYA